MRQLTCFLVSLVLVWAITGCHSGPPSAPTEKWTATSVARSPTPAVRQTPTQVSKPTETASPSLYGQELLGQSWEGRSLVAHRFGAGPRKVVVVGNIHGGTEENTYRLALEMIAHFEAHVDEVPPGVTLWIIPTANPDGLAKGTRRNAHSVDLNRNADTNADSCTENDWVEDTHVTEGIIEGGGGPYPFSEVETRALRDFLWDADVAIFYHSMAGKIFVTSCADHPASAELARTLSEGTGYPFAEEGWVSYPVTGAMVDYLAVQGVAAAEVELTTKVDTEFERNLAGLSVVMQSLEEIYQSE